MSEENKEVEENWNKHHIEALIRNGKPVPEELYRGGLHSRR